MAKCLICGRAIVGGFAVDEKPSCFSCWNQNERERAKLDKEEALKKQQDLIKKSLTTTHCGNCGHELRGRSTLLSGNKIVCWQCFMGNRQAEGSSGGVDVDVKSIISKRPRGRGVRSKVVA